MPFPIYQRLAALPIAAVVLGLLTGPIWAQTPPALQPEGRPTFEVPVGISGPDNTAKVTLERMRIKRSVPLDPKSGLSDGRWDLLYAVTEANGPKVAYFDWDSNFIYLAWESPSPEPVRFDLDGSDDGFLRGADNLRIQVAQPQDDTSSVTPTVTAELWDATKSGDRPIHTAAPLPINAIQAVAGRTAHGTYVVMVAIAKTELTGLPRTSGRNIGVRIESGSPITAPDGTTLLSNRPLVHLTLADRIEAEGNSLHVSLKILSAKQLVPGDGLRAILEAKNVGPDPIDIQHFFVHGSQASLPFVDNASFPGLTLRPGETIKRELRTTVVPSAPVASHVLTGGAAWQIALGAATPTPVTVAALASFDRVDGYYISVDADKKPILTSAERNVGGSKVVTVSVHSRIADTVRAEVSFKLPLGWSVDGGDGTERVVVLRGADDSIPIRFKVLVPGSTPPGQYLLEATATIERQTYSASATVTVEAAPAPPAPKK